MGCRRDLHAVILTRPGVQRDCDPRGFVTYRPTWSIASQLRILSLSTEIGPNTIKSKREIIPHLGDTLPHVPDLQSVSLPKLYRLPEQVNLEDER